MVLETADLRVLYGKAEGLRRATLRIEEGSIVTVIGPNGAGKTTLLGAIMGLLPSSGEVRYAGTTLAGLSVEARVALGLSLVPERRELFGELTVHDNLRLGAFTRIRRGERGIDADLEAVYARFPRLLERRTYLAETLSGGERQMLALGRALMAKPKLLMLDEPSRIGYLRITHFAKNTPDNLRHAMDALIEEGIKGIVLDLRSNPGGLLTAAIEISDMFLESGKIVSVKGRTVPERTWQAKHGLTFPNMPIAVLVNRFSASASEVLSAALQDNQRAIVVGERTFGKGSVQTVLRLESGKSLLKLTTANYYRPNGVNIHRTEDMKPEDNWGVKPSEGHEHQMSKEQWQS